MKTTGGTDEQKRRAALAAAEAVEDGMVVGLGTGSTTAFAIRELGELVAGGLDIRGVPTSFAARELAHEEEIPLASLDEISSIDLAIDGADQVATSDGALVKGGGAAHAREKIVDAFAERFLVVADPSKMAETLSHSIPVEVLPTARTTVSAAISDLGGDPVLRRAERKDGPVVTDNGNLVLDCDFGEISDSESLATSLSTVPGVVEHGIFVDVADLVYVGTADGVDVVEF
ncbi:ribose-5-phosphate isomerase RpiA [Haloferax sp. DFSO60]|uniref:ribose-5-phosphate isomerase RpiA n=1 Tax=Haloferax sp. DFSO60 TaxID=3388652 RepID=UPI00397C74C3